MHLRPFWMSWAAFLCLVWCLSGIFLFVFFKSMPTRDLQTGGNTRRFQHLPAMPGPTAHLQARQHLTKRLLLQTGLPASGLELPGWLQGSVARLCKKKKCRHESLHMARGKNQIKSNPKNSTTDSNAQMFCSFRTFLDNLVPSPVDNGPQIHTFTKIPHFAPKKNIFFNFTNFHEQSLIIFTF